MAWMRKWIESSHLQNPTNLALNEMQEELKWVIPLDSKYEKAKGIFPDSLEVKKEWDTYMFRSKGKVIYGIPLSDFTKVGDKWWYKNWLKFDRLPSPYNEYTYTAQWYKDSNGTERLSLYVWFEPNDEVVTINKEDQMYYYYPATDGDPYSFRIYHNSDWNNSFDGDPTIDMDIRETLYNSEEMKELWKDDWTVTLRRKMGDKNYNITFTNVWQWENKPRTLDIKVEPVWWKTKPDKEEAETKEKLTFKRFDITPSWMNLLWAMGDDGRMVIRDKNTWWAGWVSRYAKIQDGVGLIEIEDKLFQISELWSSYSIEKVTNNISQINSDVDEQSGVNTSWEIVSDVDDLKWWTLKLEDDTWKEITLAVSSSKLSRLWRWGVVTYEESVVFDGKASREFKISLRVGKWILHASMKPTGLGTNTDGTIVRIDKTGNETLAQMPEWVFQYEKKDIFTVWLDGEDLSIQWHRTAVSFPPNLTEEQKDLTKDLQFSNTYGWLNAPSPWWLTDNPERYALRGASEFRGKRPSSIDIKKVADNDGFMLQDDWSYTTYYENEGREVEVSLHKVVHQKVDWERWYVEMNILEVPRVEPDVPLDWYDEKKWKWWARRFGEWVADLAWWLGWTLKELAWWFMNKAWEWERPKWMSLAAIMAWLESVWVPTDPDSPDTYSTWWGYPMLFVPRTNIEKIKTWFDRVLPQVQWANIVWSPFKHNRWGWAIHDGLDIFVEELTPITMPEDGEIVRREMNHSWNYWHLVVTKNSYTTDDWTEMDAYLYYAHLPQDKSRDPLDGIVDEKFNIRNWGEWVPISKWTVIWYVSDTWNAKWTWAHLHIEAIVVPKWTSFKDVSKKHKAMADSQNPDDPRRDTEWIHPIRLFPDVNRRGNIPNGWLDDTWLWDLPEAMEKNESKYLDHINKEWNLNLEPVKWYPFNQEKRDIIPALLPNAKELSKVFWVPVSIILAQAINESWWWTGNVLKNTNSLYNITANWNWKWEKYTSWKYVYRKYNFLSQSMFDYVTFLALQDQKFKWAFGKPANKRPWILKKMGYMEAPDGAKVLLDIMKSNDLTQYDLTASPSTTVTPVPNTPDAPKLEVIKHKNTNNVPAWETIIVDHEKNDEWALLTREIKEVIWKPKIFDSEITDLSETWFLDSSLTIDTSMELFKYVELWIEKSGWEVTYILKDKDGKKVFSFGTAEELSSTVKENRFYYDSRSRRWVTPKISEWKVTVNWKKYTFKYKFWIAMTDAQLFLLVDE